MHKKMYLKGGCGIFPCSAFDKDKNGAKTDSRNQKINSINNAPDNNPILDKERKLNA